MSNYEFWDELGKIFEAVVAYQEKSVEFNKRFIHPWIRLGNVFDKQDRNTEALRAYQQAIELEPGNAQNWYELGNIHFQMNNQVEAEQAYSKSIELAPGSGWPYSNLALSLATQGKYVEAVPLYQKSIDLLEESKDRAVAWNRLGNAYRKLDEYELALQAFQKADELDEENAGFRDELDEVTEGPSLVEGASARRADSKTEMTVEPVLLSLGETQAEETAPAQARVEGEDSLYETQTERVDVASETTGPVAEAAVEEPDTLPLEVQTVLPDTSNSPAAQPGPATEAASEPVEEVLSDAPAHESVPAWVTETPAIEIAQSEKSLSSAETESVTGFAVEAAAASEESVSVESDLPMAAGEESVAIVAQESSETFTDSVAVPDSSTETLDVAAPAEEQAPVLASSDEEVAAVDPEQGFDEIVLTEETAPDLKESPSPETIEAAAPQPAVHTEAQEPITEPVAVIAENVEAAELQAAPATVHAAYDEFLKDNRAPLDVLAAESSAEASAEPVAQIDASGEIQIEMDTKNAHVWNELGNVYFSTAAYEDAIVAYTKAIELDRWFAWPYSNLALAYVQKGRFAEATLLYQRSIELFASDKDKAISWNRLGNVYRRLNDYDNAIAAYQRADELDPENTTLSLQSRFSLLGNFYMEQKPSYAA